MKKKISFNKLIILLLLINKNCHSVYRVLIGIIIYTIAFIKYLLAYICKLCCYLVNKKGCTN